MIPDPTLSSILLASTDPERLTAWYCAALDATVSEDGFLSLGGFAVLIALVILISIQDIQRLITGA